MRKPNPHPTQSRQRKEALLPQIARLALEGDSIRKIAAAFGLTKSTVSRWLQDLREGCPTRVAGSAEIIAHAVAHYDALYREALDAWHLSQADKETESVVEIETARGPKKKRTVRTESQAGAPVFLAEARRALDGIARIAVRIAPRPGKVGVPISDGTVERGTCVAVPPRPDTAEATDPKLSHPEPMAGITAERDEYVAVPPRPGTAEAPKPKLSHPMPMAGITAERDEYAAVPRRPSEVESLAPKLSHPESMAGITAERDEYVDGAAATNAAAVPLSQAVLNAGNQTPQSLPEQPDENSVNAPKCPNRETARTATEQKRNGVGQAVTARLDGKRHSQERKPPFSAGFSVWQPRPMVDMSSLIRGIPRRQNSELGFKCPISITATPIVTGTARACSGLRTSTSRSRGRGKQPRQAGCAPGRSGSILVDRVVRKTV